MNLAQREDIFNPKYLLIACAVFLVVSLPSAMQVWLSTSDMLLQPRFWNAFNYLGFFLLLAFIGWVGASLIFWFEIAVMESRNPKRTLLTILSYIFALECSLYLGCFIAYQIKF